MGCFETFYFRNDTIDGAVTEETVREIVRDELSTFIVVRDVDPTITENLPQGTIWVNKTSGEVFVCKDDTPDRNVWQGQLGTIVEPTTINIVDIFRDGSGIALFQLDGNANDTGGVYNGIESYVGYGPGKFGQCAMSTYSSQITIPLNYDKDVITISFWARSNGQPYRMPIGFYFYNLTLSSLYFGFNTASGDIYGIFNPFNTTDFFHVVAEFHEGDYTLNNLWINGVRQTLRQLIGRQNRFNAIIQNVDFHIFGWGADGSHRNFGSIDQVRIFNRALSDDEVLKLYNER